jgi:hypothetical protein
LQSAIADWNAANNTSGVAFLPADASHPATLTINNGSTNVGVGASTTITSVNLNVTNAATVIGINTLNSAGQPIYSPTQNGYSTIFLKVGLHEIGHTFGLTDVTGTNQSAGQTVENQISGTNDVGNMIATNVTACDNQTVSRSTRYSPVSGGGGGGGDTCCTTVDCGARYTCNGNCACQFSSPIIIDIEGEGFRLTSAEGGVDFDIGAMGYKQHVSWTDARYHNAFLVLDRNHDGVINDAKELFGSATPQPTSADPNGFLALAVYDMRENGGNGDGVIDSRDAIWPDLRLWIDASHDGISQPDELVRLEDEGVYSIKLKYQLTPVKDEFGNEFVYKGHVNARSNVGGDEANRTIYDVILVLANPGKRNCHDRKAGQLLQIE